MIPYDWQQRLKKDCKDFVESKIPKGDYDFEIIYNAYPERINGEIPQVVITFVAKEIRKKIATEPVKYMDFLQYIQKNKGPVGKRIFNSIMQKVVLRNPGKYNGILKNLIKETKDEPSVKKMFDNIILPLLKKYPGEYIDELIEWVRVDASDLIIGNIFRVLSNCMKTNKNRVQEIFEKCESFWNSENQCIRRGNTLILKTLYLANKDLYREVYKNYQSTYNPSFIEILAGAIREDSQIIRQSIEKWNRSGNIKIKKSAAIAKKNLAKLKRK
jgi:hypothetical protein